MKRFYDKAAWTVSHQGETEYKVGPHVSGNGYPTVRIRHSLWHSLIASRQNPETFWTEEIPKIGLILWKYCPWATSKEFPDPEVAAMFPGYVLARYRDDWTVEPQGEWLILVATNFHLTTLQQHQEDIRTGIEKESTEILWQGTAPEMSKALWFELIFPKLNPGVQEQIKSKLTSGQR